MRWKPVVSKGTFTYSTFDLQSPVLLDLCERSIPCPSTARFVGPGTFGRGGLQHGVDAQALAQARSADIAVTVCGGFIEFRQTTAYEVQIKSSGKILSCLFDHWYHSHDPKTEEHLHCYNSFLWFLWYFVFFKNDRFILSLCCLSEKEEERICTLPYAPITFTCKWVIFQQCNSACSWVKIFITLSPLVMVSFMVRVNPKLPPKL